MDRRAATDVPQYEVRLPAGGIALDGILGRPWQAQGVVVFAHGSGSGRFSPRNSFVAQQLQAAGLGTLLIDLLTEPEAQDRDLVFDIGLLTERLLAATEWLEQASQTGGLRIGYFGASTGAAAALQAAASVGERVGAVVSRGGRPDLATESLPGVRAPTLLIVGELDEVLDLNRQAYESLRVPRELVVVPGATHLFEEPGALEQVAEHAGQWFGKWLVASG